MCLNQNHGPHTFEIVVRRPVGSALAVQRQFANFTYAPR
jgi:hypothetical protein